MINGRPMLSVVLVSYNTREMTLRCLASLFDDLAELASEVWLVDNASGDGTVQAVSERYPSIRIIANNGNAGFGAANNQAMRQATGKYILLLNTDAFICKGTIGCLLEFIERQPEYGVVGPRLLNVNGTLQRSCYRFPSPGRAWSENLWLPVLFPNSRFFGDYRKWAHDEEREVDWVVGACMLLRREVFERTSGFDETFFMYSEEADWQRRIRASGWKIGFSSKAEVIHLGGASGANEKARINRHFFESVDYYQLKHHGFVGLVSLRAAMVLGCSMRAVLWCGGLMLPSRRSVAASKLRMHAWLVGRQLSHWRVRTVGRLQ